MFVMHTHNFVVEIFRKKRKNFSETHRETGNKKMVNVKPTKRFPDPDEKKQKNARHEIKNRELFRVQAESATVTICTRKHKPLKKTAIKCLKFNFLPSLASFLFVRLILLTLNFCLFCSYSS